MSNSIKVLKQNLKGEITWQYQGRVLHRESNKIVLEANFNRRDLPFMNTIFREGDRFVETFYSDRWYNIFEIHDRADDRLKGWYCNIGKPAVIEADSVSYVDLALDLWVAADGTQTLLDQDEFKQLDLDAESIQMAWWAVENLKARFNAHP